MRAYGGHSRLAKQAQGSPDLAGGQIGNGLDPSLKKTRPEFSSPNYVYLWLFV